MTAFARARGAFSGWSSRALFLLACGALLPSPARADTITLLNGRVIEADRAWYEGEQLRYEKNGGIYGLPRSLVKNLEQKAPPDPSSDPDILKARERLAQGDPITATRLLRRAINRDPLSVPALQAMTEAYLALGDARAAQDSARKAVRLNERNPRSLALLGDALVALGDRATAEAEYRKSYQLHPDPEVRRKLGDTAPAPTGPSRGAQFRIQYDGGINEPLGSAVQKSMTEAYEEFGRRLQFTPEDPITIVLQTGAVLTGDRLPEWAAGINDGTIRVPVRGLDQPTPKLLSILRHELAHSFVAAKTGGNCPTWLHEGIAQWLEGGDPNRESATVAAAAREGRLIPLLSLEGPFQNLSEVDATLAYAESLSAIAHILAKRGEAGVVRLLSALGDRLPSEEALPVSLALSYPEFQKSWEDSLRAGNGAAANRSSSRP